MRAGLAKGLPLLIFSFRGRFRSSRAPTWRASAAEKSLFDGTSQCLVFFCDVLELRLDGFIVAALRDDANLDGSVAIELRA